MTAIMRCALSFAVIAALSATGACTGKRFSEIVGYGKSPPDEFAVRTYPSLIVPPGYDLPPPGEKRTAAVDAGDVANLSPGERALLGSLKAVEVSTSGVAASGASPAAAATGDARTRLAPLAAEKAGAGASRLQPPPAETKKRQTLGSQL